MWDQAAAIAALVSARKLNIISIKEFESELPTTTLRYGVGFPTHCKKMSRM